MSLLFSDIKTAVKEKCDGRTFSDAQNARWANFIRKTIEGDWLGSGFNYYYFLYKEATVVGGSEADESNYAQPDDFVTDLNIWYDNGYIVKAPPGIANATQDLTATGTPKWMKMAGLEFQLIPVPDEDDKEIKLIYGAMASEIPAASNNSFTDYFLKRYPDVHIFGMASHAAESIGQNQIADKYSKRYEMAVAKLALANRRHWLSNARIRFQNWHEFADKKTILFPQFQET